MARQKRTEDMSTSNPLPELPEYASGTTETSAPDRERIASRAYELYLARGAEHGHDQEDWFEAERELGQPRSRKD